MVTQQGVIFSNERGMISCLDQHNGSVHWVTQCRHGLGWGVTDLGDWLLALTEKGHMHVIDKITGRKLSRDRISSMVGHDVITQQPPAVCGNLVYLATNDSGILCLEMDLDRIG